MELAALIHAGEQMHRELGREYYLTGAGLKSDPAFQEIYRRYERLGGDHALETARASGSKPLLDWVVGVRIGQRIAPLEEEQLRWEQSAEVEVDDQRIAYLRIPVELANSPDRAFRTALDRERAKAGAAALNPLRVKRFLIEREEVSRLQLGDYVESIGYLSEIDLEGLARQAAAFVDETNDMYADCLGWLVKRRVGVPIEELTRADTQWTFRADQFDAAFPPAEMLDLATRQMREMGLDAVQSGRVHFDTDDRPEKQPRAFCVPVEVPNEVYLVLRPMGGHSDYRTFWHELGHAMHFASIDPDLPFAARWLGDNSVTEAFAMLWDHLTIDRRWLARYTDLGVDDATNLVFELAVSELHLIRRYAAKLNYELVLHRSDPESVADEYAEQLSRATLFRYPPDNALIDVDPAFYAARYLRAWQLEAGLAQELVQHYDVDWWRNPRAGARVQHLMSRGQADPAHRLAAEVLQGDLSFAPCLQRLRDTLA